MTKKARHISEDAPEKKENLEDWFSRFPDDILIHIISGLTLKEAARTSVLSSRWKYLWTFTTSLDFDKKVKYMSFPPDYQQSKYISWVNKVLELHRGSRINQFRICFRLDAKHKCNITNWVNTAIAKNVRNFELDLSPGTYDNYYEIPQECYKNLQSGCGLSGIKSLRSLTLCAVNVTGEVVEFFIHNCPLLENLRITQSPDLLSLKVVGSSIPLKCLDIQFCYSIKEIEISAPNLLSFKYIGQDINLHVGSLPQLVDVVFHVTPMVQKMHCIGSIVSYLPQLKTLELDGCNEVFAQFSQREFPKLMNLNISFTAANQETLLGLSFIMKACPFLEKLVLQDYRWAGLDFMGRLGIVNLIVFHDHEMNPPSKISSSSSLKSTKSLNRNCSKKIEQRTKKQQLCSRNPLKNLNTTIINNSSGNNNSCSTSTSSIEAPKGCLRFFLSHSSSSNSKTPLIDRPVKIKTLAKTTPKSAPNLSKPSRRSILQKPSLGKGEKVKKDSTFLYQLQSGKKSSSRNVSKCKISLILDTGGSPVNKVTSGPDVRFCDGNVVDLTPLSKIATESGLDCAVDKKVIVGVDVVDVEKLSNGSGSRNRTPPIQASVSPELHAQSDLSVTATSRTPACYGAGHVVSGITDKRKCRPRGLLIVGDNNMLDFGSAKAADSFEEREGNNKENIVGVVDNSRRVSIVPLPAEACMHWLLSPCSKEDYEQKENTENGSRQFQIHSPSSSLFNDEISLDLCNKNSNRRVSIITRRGSNSLCSPCGVPEFQGISDTFHENLVISSSPNRTPICKAADLEAENKGRYDFNAENSPFSTDTFGSGNVIQTPQSDSSPDRPAGLSWLKTEACQNHQFNSESDLLTECIHMASLSSKGYESIWDPTSSSFQFDCVMTPSNSVDLSQYQKVLDDRDSWTSTSTVGYVSQSQMRISWREGLMSRIFEMDEFDSCRYLSDEEEDVGGCDNDLLKPCQNPDVNADERNYEILKNDFGSTEDVDTKTGVKGKGEERVPSQITCSCAESISTDGGGLAASGDSDWTLCYKNHLFQV
ncbi:GPI-anchored adhesin-like protein [Citrus sinensis]|uniref:GPI-anchored adhesin-like protein n=2 Tax=Citrus sinensis TaxID=2711 RepID=A0ACB8M9R0_CITSI|nr:GPI-anchored adhesin-like protein [Citrus sinensis]